MRINEIVYDGVDRWKVARSTPLRCLADICNYITSVRKVIAKCSSNFIAPPRLVQFSRTVSLLNNVCDQSHVARDFYKSQKSIDGSRRPHSCRNRLPESDKAISFRHLASEATFWLTWRSWFGAVMWSGAFGGLCRAGAWRAVKLN